MHTHFRGKNQTAEMSQRYDRQTHIVAGGFTMTQRNVLRSTVFLIKRWNTATKSPNTILFAVRMCSFLNTMGSSRSARSSARMICISRKGNAFPWHCVCADSLRACWSADVHRPVNEKYRVIINQWRRGIQFPKRPP